MRAPSDEYLLCDFSSRQTSCNWHFKFPTLFLVFVAGPYKPYSQEQLLKDFNPPGGRVQPESARVHNAELGEGCLKLTFPPSALPAELRLCS